MFSPKSTFSYLVLLGIVLVVSSVIKDGIGVLSMLIFIILYFRGDRDNMVLFIIGWLYVSKYFVAQGLISNQNVFNLLFSGKLYVLITVTIYSKKRWLHHKESKKLIQWALLFLLIVFSSDLYHGSVGINMVNEALFIFVYLLVLHLPRKENFSNNLMSLLISIGILQLIVSFLQTNQYISPPSLYSMSGQLLRTANLDDAASGTFGAYNSNSTSFFATVLFFSIISYGIMMKNRIAIIFSFSFLLHYSMIDSKTALAVSTIGFLMLLIKHRVFNIFRGRNVILITFVIVFALSINSLMKKYYNEVLTDGYTNTKVQIYDTYNTAIYNIGTWGKLAGFVNISTDWSDTDILQYIFGYGRDNFSYSNNGGRIEAMDDPIMRMNNITRSRSSLISIYGWYGIPGIIALLYLYIFVLFPRGEVGTSSKLLRSGNIAIQVSAYSSLIFMFLYAGISHKDLSFMLIFILMAYVARISPQSILESKM
jgi:hypothetical protein